MTGETEHPALVAAARHGLGDTRNPVPLDPPAAGRVLARARFDRLSGFLATAVMAGAVTVDDDAVTSSLDRQWHDELLLCVRLEALAVRTATLLDGAGITWRLTKGAALAHLDYPQPSVRTFGDVDLVVNPSEWSAAFGLLTGHGYRREAVTLPGDYDARYGKGATLTTADGLEVDLHRRFAIGRFGVTATMEPLFSSTETIHLAGRKVPVLDAPGRLLHACFHAALGGFRGLRALRDVAQLILVTAADWDAAFGLARSWRAEAVVAAAIRDSWEVLDLPLDHPAYLRAVATPVSRLDEGVLRMFARSSTFRSQALSALGRLPLAEVPRYLWSLAFPTLRRQS